MPAAVSRSPSTTVPSASVRLTRDSPSPFTVTGSVTLTPVAPSLTFEVGAFGAFSVESAEEPEADDCDPSPLSIVQAAVVARATAAVEATMSRRAVVAGRRPGRR